MRHPNLVAIASCLSALALAGCGDDAEPGAAAGCLVGAEAYVKALEAAPDPVTLGGTSISDCLTEEQSAGQIAAVGETLVAAATELNEKARRQPLGDATVDLGYLVGVVEARAEETGGIHSDLAINVESAATYVPKGEVLPGGFQQRYEEGLRAGRSNG